MFDRQSADVPLRLHIQKRVLVQITGFSDRRISELDVHGVRIGKVSNFHGVNPRSKNALWTVSPSVKRITRRYGCSGGSTTCGHMIVLDWLSAQVMRHAPGD